jgi:hypothetical protein
MPDELSPEQIARSHRWHAIECNNLAWSLSDRAERTPAEDDEMLDAAHGSAFHWSRAGDALHRARADMLLGRVHAVLGDGSAALAYAQRSLDYLLAHDPPDWEIAFAHAIVAQAGLAAGDAALHGRHYREAVSLGDAIADPEDRAIFDATFATIPAP